MPRGRNSNKPPFVILADPNDQTSEVIAQYCGGCKTHRPVAAFYTSRIVWRRGFCKSCDLNHQNGRNRANPLRARIQALRVQHGAVHFTVAELAAFLTRNGHTDHTKTGLRNLRFLKRPGCEGLPLSAENCVMVHAQS